jgi:hypothetical protein
VIGLCNFRHGHQTKEDYFKWKIICDTPNGSEPNIIAGWNGKLSSVGPIVAVQVMSNKYKIIEGEIKCGVISKKRMNMTRS